MTDEHAQLIDRLDAQRAHILGALDGLDEEQLRRPILPSGWTCLGLVKHLTLADERYWFRCVIGGESTDYFPDEPGADWLVAPSETSAEIVSAYRDEIDLANELLRVGSLDAPPRWRDPLWDQWGQDFPDRRTIVLHMIVETATHAGHLDAVRELIDGRQWITL
ncbi:MAG TPA: DinB family protein [Acidimicrobiales bacterium]|nr:DinB family protein [Acidimicrobiales bacterium]